MDDLEIDPEEKNFIGNLDRAVVNFGLVCFAIDNFMSQNEAASYYQIGGSLASDSPSYVVRKADRELEVALDAGEFCYVLNSRQMGKSSLRVRAMSRLQARGIVCVFVDLTGMGTQNLSPEKWYAGIIYALVSSSQLKLDWRKWWRENRDLFTPVQLLTLFIEEVLLVEILFLIQRSFCPFYDFCSFFF